MRILVTIPHYYSADRNATSSRHSSTGSAPEQRLAAVANCILALHHLFGSRQKTLNIAERRIEGANEKLPSEVHVVLCAIESHQLISRLPIDRSLFQYHPVDLDPRMLGFQCRRILRDRWGNYDYFAYLEDDLILHDPWLFAKLDWFTQHLGDDKLLLPNRFEFGGGSTLDKLYVDGELAPHVTARFQNIADQSQVTGSVLGKHVLFRRPLNPHSGCYFLNARQMEHWMNQPFFLDDDTSFIGPLESAATLGVMRAFKIYKPAAENASFLEIQHYGRAFVNYVSSLK